MKVRALIAINIFAAALPALAATSCPTPQVLVGTNCTLTSALGWLTAGQGTQTVITIFVPPNALAPVDFEITGLASSLGNAYTGFFGLMGNEIGQTSGSQILTLADIEAGGPDSIGTMSQGSVMQFVITQVCWDPTCTASAPTGAVPNMFNLQFITTSPNNTDIGLTNPGPQGTIQFLSGSRVTFETQVFTARTDSPNSIIPGISIGATPATRYILNGAAYTAPFDVVSLSNLNNTNSLGGTAILQDENGNNVAMGTIPTIPPGGSGGFLVVGASSTGTASLFPSTTVLPASPDGIFHGTLILQTTGQTVNGFMIVGAQEFNGNAMLNLHVYQSSIP